MKVSRWGNSLALRLPAKLVAELELTEGDELQVDKLGSFGLRLSKEISREEIYERAAKIRWELPKDYKFDRDEANAR